MTLITLVLAGLVAFDRVVAHHAAASANRLFSDHARRAASETASSTKHLATTIAKAVADGIAAAVTVIEHGPTPTAEELEAIAKQEPNSGDRGDFPLPADDSDPTDLYMPDPDWLHADIQVMENFDDATDMFGIPGLKANIPPIGER